MKKIFSILAISLMLVNLNYGQNMKLVVGDQIKIKGGTPGLNKILISDANGLASWSNISTLNAWGINGNTGTSETTNFIGTTDNVGLNIKTNNTTRINITADGDINLNGNVIINRYHKY